MLVLVMKGKTSEKKEERFLRRVLISSGVVGV